MAVLGALAAPLIAAVQVWNEGSAATVERAAWWLRVGLFETGFLLVIVLTWVAKRRERSA